ncbi:MAG TPA: hypothetical protein VLB79_11095 [Solirubrobacterales bacterium]|nr:hypothetical protein [Solirubrobacterales bacterium]
MPTNYQVAQAGEHLVAAEIFRRGGYAALLIGNRPKVDLFASSPEQDRTVSIQVKAKSDGKRGGWQTKTTYGERRKKDPEENAFWILVDVGNVPPRFWIVPEWWMLNYIYERTKRLKLDTRPGGTTHFAIRLPAVDEWRDRWDLLGIFPDV